MGFHARKQSLGASGLAKTLNAGCLAEQVKDESAKIPTLVFTAFALAACLLGAGVGVAFVDGLNAGEQFIA